MKNYTQSPYLPDIVEQRKLERRQGVLEARVLADRHGGAHGKAHPGPVSVMDRPNYVPPQNAAARLGADDHQRIASKGF